MYLILLLCKRLSISSNMVPEILAKKRRISFCCGPCAKSLLQNGGNYCNARDFGSQLVLFWLLGGCFDKSQQCQSSNHSWAQCYLSEVLLLTSWLLFLFVLFHCSLTVVHTSAISWGIAVALPMQKIPKHCGKIRPIQTRSDKKQAHSTQFKNVQSKNTTIWKTQKDSNKKIKRPVTFFNQEHSMNISNIHKQNKHPTQPKKAFGTANTCLMSGSRAWNTISNHSFCSLKAALVQKLMDFEFGMSLSRLMSAPRNDNCALLVMKINLGSTAFALCRARRFRNHSPGRRFIEDVWFKERGIALYHSFMALRYGRARLLGRMWCKGRWSWAYLTHATANTQTRFERRFFLFAWALS